MVQNIKKIKKIPVWGHFRWFGGQGNPRTHATLTPLHVVSFSVGDKPPLMQHHVTHLTCQSQAIFLFFLYFLINQQKLGLTGIATKALFPFAT